MNLRLLGFLIITGLCLSAFSCKNSTEPEAKKPQAPDSTSQDFTFEVKRFGRPGPTSLLNDVWIFNENDIWATGTLSLKDTTAETGSQIYNIMHWNGKEWKGINKEYVELEGIWGFPGKTFIASGGVWILEDDSLKRQTIDKPLNGQLIHYLWASAEDNVWGVGPWGGIIHFDGKTWTKVDFDRQWYFYSITGSKTTGVAYALALNSQYQTIIVKLQNSIAEVIYRSASQNTEFNGWTLTLANEKELYIGNNPIWKFNIETKAMKVLFYPSEYTSIGASFAVSPIDIYFYGINYTSDVLIHYNGKRFKEFALPVHSDNPKGIKATSAIAAAVSLAENQAQIITIKRR
ncbi:MAG: hypothetical protein ACM3U0_01880 [archaeon]